MVLTIGRSEVECESFRVRGAYSNTIARLFALPAAVESKEPLTLEVTIKGNKFKPYKASRRVYWNKKHVGFFVLSNVSQEWDGDKYRTRLELKQCERSEIPDEDIPAYKWRHDLRALADNLPQTDGAKIEAGRTIDPFADSWKLGTTNVADAGDEAIVSPAVLPVSQGGTGASDPAIAIINLGGVSSASKGIAFGVAPLGADGKVPSVYLPPGSGGGGSNVVFPITIAQGGTNALDAATARTNLGAVSSADLTSGLALKVDTSVYSAAIALKADASAVSSALSFKADASAVATALALKVDTSVYTAGIALKLDANLRSAANGVAPLGADSLVPSTFLPAYPTLSSLGAVASSTYTAGLALKLDANLRSAANGVAPLGADSLVPSTFLPAYPTLSSLGAVASSTYTAGLALKLDASTRNAANGVAGLDANSLISTTQIPLSVQFQFLARSGGSVVDLNSLSGNHACIRWLDGSVTNLNLPGFANSGTVIQYDSLLVGAPGLYKYQIFISHSNRIAERHQSNGTWGSWNERTYLNRAQSFTALQDFAAGATFKAGGIPPVTTTMTQQGVDASGNPRMWLVNAAATAGNRLKSITVATNGNVQIRHHADDGTDGNVLEHTASGNILTNGTLRCGGGSSNFSGASFIPGALYYRSDIAMLTYSDGTNWRRMDTNAIV